MTDPSTRVMSIVLRVDGVSYVYVPSYAYPRSLEHLDLGHPVTWLHDDAGPWLEELTRTHTFVAHNAEGFDALVWERLVAVGDPAWYDTVPACRAGGYPGSLDGAAFAMFGERKDSAGSKAMKMLTRAKMRAGTPVYPQGTEHLWRDMLRYNVVDVLLLERIYHETLEFGEADVLDAHVAVNARGIAVDLGFLARLKGVWSELEHYALTRVMELVPGLDSPSAALAFLRSGPRMHKWLRSMGLHMETLERKHVEQMYEEPEEFFAEADFGNAPTVVEVLKLRQTATRAGRGKLEAIEDRLEPDGRVRRLLRYYGAHTGRWSGSGIQPQNFARPTKGVDVERLVKSPTLSLEEVLR